MANIIRTRPVHVDTDTLEITNLTGFYDVEYASTNGVNDVADCIIPAGDAIYLLWTTYDTAGYWWTSFKASGLWDSDQAEPAGHTQGGWLGGWLNGFDHVGFNAAVIGNGLAVVFGDCIEDHAQGYGAGLGGYRTAIYLVETTGDGEHLTIVDVAPVASTEPAAVAYVGDNTILAWGEYDRVGVIGQEQLGFYAAAQWIKVDTTARKFLTEGVPTQGPLPMEVDGWVGEKINSIDGRGWIPAAFVLAPKVGPYRSARPQVGDQGWEVIY